MNGGASAGATVAAAVLACGCAHTVLAPEERAHVCSVAIEQPAEPAVFHRNRFFDPVAGPAIGVIGGAATFFSLGPLARVTAGQAAELVATAPLPACQLWPEEWGRAAPQ